MHSEQPEIVESAMTNIAFECIVIVGDMFVQMFWKFAAFEEFDATHVAYVQTDFVLLLHMGGDATSVSFEFIVNVTDQARIHSVISRDHL